MEHLAFLWYVLHPSLNIYAEGATIWLLNQVREGTQKYMQLHA